MINFYAILASLAVVNLIVFLFLFREKKLNYYILAIFTLITVSNGGNYLIALADTLEEAFIAKKIIYVGGCFIPPLILFVILKMCHINIRKWLENVLVLFSCIVYAMVLTIGYNGMFYKSATLGKDGNATVIIPEYGLGHTLFYILLYGYLLLGIVILLYSLQKKNHVSRKNLWVLIGLEVMTIALFLLGRVIDPDLEVLPLIYVIDEWILMYLSGRVNVYSLEDNIISFLDKQGTYGYIMFDNQRNYLGASDLAIGILPELAQCKIDSPITGITALDFLQTELDEFDKENNITFELNRDENHYEGHINRIWYAEKAVGYVFEIENTTDKYKYAKLLSEYNDTLRSEIEQKTAHIKNMQAKVLLAMADIVENRDGNTGGHIKRTSHVVELLINTIMENNLLPLEKEFCQAVIKAAPMHDLGKIAIDDKILRKPGRLTDEEFAIMQTHAAKSGELVESILEGLEDDYFVTVAKNLARHHHEKWNGAGYPDHLAGEDIPMEARIMAIADVYDALVSKRCYKDAMSFEQAYNVMMESMGSHFDPSLEEVFVKSREKLEEYYSS